MSVLKIGYQLIHTNTFDLSRDVHVKFIIYYLQQDCNKNVTLKIKINRHQILIANNILKLYKNAVYYYFIAFIILQLLEY